MNPYGDFIRKVMIYQHKPQEIYVFLYTSMEDEAGANADHCCTCLEDALESCAKYGVAESDWIEISDPLPFCQHDRITPVRIKGRDQGKPELGKMEALVNGAWVELASK